MSRRFGLDTTSGEPASSLPLQARAPAKVNLCLHVGACRSDGLHEICSLVQSVTLADDVVLRHAGGGTDELVCRGVEGPNLAARALAAFRERFDWDSPPLRIEIEKRIPVAAGLGGGSADAAAVLRLAVAASGVEPRPDALAELAMTLGADVPSQLDPGTHLVTGAGERLERLRTPDGLALLVLNPEERLAVAEVYARADALGLPGRELASLAPHIRANVERAAGAPSLAPLVHNDLERAALDLSPPTKRVLELLRGEGALAAALSGSGPSGFGLFPDARAAEQARAAIAGRFDGLAIAVQAVPEGYAVPRPAAAASSAARRSGSGQ